MKHSCDAINYWLTKISNLTSSLSVISSFEYLHDKVGNRTKMTLNGGDYVDYVYDETYQLTSETRIGSTPYALSYTYDEVGNRLTQIKDAVTTEYDYNDANQLLTDGTADYQYDPNGNQIGKTIGSNTETWGYDFENRQVSYGDPQNPGNYTDYRYDAEGKRTKKIGYMGTSERYVYDGANVVADYNEMGVLQATYVTPFLDQNLLVERSGSTYHYFQDGLGSVRELLDSSTQALVNSYDYYAFGEILNETEAVTNRYKFTGREWDDESQTYYYRARQYDPYAGRFTVGDPIGYRGGIGLYSYVRNNPVNMVDPMGLDEEYWRLTNEEFDRIMARVADALGAKEREERGKKGKIKKKTEDPPKPPVVTSYKITKDPKTGECTMTEGICDKTAYDLLYVYTYIDALSREHTVTAPNTRCEFKDMVFKGKPHPDEVVCKYACKRVTDKGTLFEYVKTWEYRTIGSISPICLDKKDNLPEEE